MYLKKLEGLLNDAQKLQDTMLSIAPMIGEHCYIEDVFSEEKLTLYFNEVDREVDYE